MCCNCSRRAKFIWAWTCSIVISVMAIALGLIWLLVVRKEIEKEFVLQPGTKVYDSWLAPPIDMYLELYAWNWTNAEDYQSEGYKPELVELGPYTFLEKHERVNLQWNDDSTVSFQQKRTWHFVPELSKGDFENDKVVTINPIVLTIGYSLIAAQKEELLEFMNGLINFNPDKISSPFYNVPVKDILFDGYEDAFLTALLELVEIVPGLENEIEIPPFDKFGWFYGRNGSETYDGNFTIGTGLDSLANLGIMRLWNGENRTDYFRDDCGLVRGTTGELWPAFQYRDWEAYDATVFSTDICSTMSLKYGGKYSLHGVDGYQWIGNYEAFDNGHIYESSTCQCTAAEEECPVLAPGALDVSRCNMGAPATVSYPHFYLGDVSYRKAFNGSMKPNKADHEFILALEPLTGIPLTVKAQLQVNLMVKQYGFDLFKDIPEMMLPVIWFRQRAELSEDMASDLKLLIIVYNNGVYLAIALGVLGFIALAVTTYYTCKLRTMQSA
ncbi:protein croquemort-like [Uranotaenia lowii]|uniref:protein croquemort-like n=1 Tax=Uranotaenia lowii TaxID=190385 RepID=UPI00247ABBA3|nr:protein croquemort-like [Uranotaenia lowii]